jgi:cytochrome c peroxidase
MRGNPAGPLDDAAGSGDSVTNGAPRSAKRRAIARPAQVLGVIAVACAAAWGASAGTRRPLAERDPLEPFENATGMARTLSTTGEIDMSNPFFQSLGTNGRACVTCHQPSTGWTIVPSELRDRFEATGGLDPVFRTNDGSNSPWADVTTIEARRSAYSMLLSKGLIRIGLPIPASAEFSLDAVDDPYGYASATELSLFRRPSPSTNVAFLSGVMWDGRETFAGKTMAFNLMDQANTATTGHAQASIPLTAEQRQEIVAFETSLFTAQVFDADAGDLTDAKARGGPRSLERQDFFIGINDPLGLNPKKTPFSPVVFTAFKAWGSPRTDLRDGIPEKNRVDDPDEARAAVARGQAIFNSRRIDIVGVSGLNDELRVATIPGTCGTCHDTPNVGNHSVAAPLNIGLTDASRRTPDLPLYTLKRNTTGETIQTTDPGRALVTGRWKDIGRFKGPVLRALSARAPYFHNGSAATLTDAVQFYNTRFQIGLTDAEVADLVAFLRVL